MIQRPPSNKPREEAPGVSGDLKIGNLNKTVDFDPYGGN